MSGDRLPRQLRARAARESAARPPASRCRCSHAKSNHSPRGGQCWSPMCGCRAWAPPTDDGPQDAA